MKTVLPTLGGNTEVLAQNDLGQVIGWSYKNDGKKRAFVWDKGSMIDLGTLTGHAESEAFGINSNGWIVGYSQDATGAKTAVLWEPIVPEPHSIVTLLCGFGGLAAGIKRRRG